MKLRLLFILFFLITTFFGGVFWVFALDECMQNPSDWPEDKVKQCLSEIQQESSSLQASIEPNEVRIKDLEARIKTLQRSIDLSVANMKKLENEVKVRSEKVSTSYSVLLTKTRELYKRLRAEPLWSSLLIYENLGQVRREMVYRQESNDRDRQIIINLVEEIGQLEVDKKKVESEKVRLTGMQIVLDKENESLQKVVKEAKAYQSVLTKQLSALSARQQAILSEKQGTFSTTVGDVPLADDVSARPDYNPGFSPAFAAFSFGAPHFKGMSQYGAFGRAKSGQSVEDILHAYYGGIEIKKDYDSGKQISVQGYGRMSIETYMKRIYEVPNSWGDNGGMEALKAQAVAARSYALAWTNEGNGGAICTTQACQVYKNSDKGGKWEEAVNATRGWVLWNNGKPFKAWYASTSGGYQESYTDTNSGHTTPSLWDTPSGRGGWTSQAYEKTGGSPWFYKGWYKGTSGDSCGRNHPWLTAEEMADILNAWVVLKNGSDDRVAPMGSCWGGNPYSVGELRDKSRGVGGGYERVSGVSVSYSDGGYTSNVHFDTDKGGVDIGGADFKKVFNLRAPGRISLKSGLFNIEKK